MGLCRTLARRTRQLTAPMTGGKLGSMGRTVILPLAWHKSASYHCVENLHAYAGKTLGAGRTTGGQDHFHCKRAHSSQRFSSQHPGSSTGTVIHLPVYLHKFQPLHKGTLQQLCVYHKRPDFAAVQ